MRLWLIPMIYVAGSVACGLALPRIEQAYLASYTFDLSVTSAQAWLSGFPRVAGWLLVLSAFGIWALSAQRMERDSLAVDVYDVDARPSTFARVARRLAGFTAGALAGGLAIEAVVKLLSVVFKCPGCAG